MQGFAEAARHSRRWHAERATLPDFLIGAPLKPKKLAHLGGS
jgi:hypothetical protein